MDHKGLTRLLKIRELNANPKWENHDLYRLMYKEDLYIAAYERIKSKPGNMTKGSDDTTIDGFSKTTIQNIIGQMRDQKFQFTRAKRIHIPKANGKLRPLGIPSPKDKVVQEVMRLIIEAIYDGPEPTFLDCSHGFRSGRGTHSCLKAIRAWPAMNWFVEGDIKGCFDNIDHEILIRLLSKRIKDQKFIDLVWKALKAGYMEGTTSFNSVAGTPQGSILSPILANVYLHEFDKWTQAWIERESRPHVGIDLRKRINPAYTKVVKELNRIKDGKKRVDPETYRSLVKTKYSTTSILHNDEGVIRIKMVRYADDWIVAIDGPKALAERFKDEATEFFKQELKLELSAEKTLIANCRIDKAKFLGTNLKIRGGQDYFVRGLPPRGRKLIKKRIPVSQLMKMTVPLDDILKRLRDRGFIDGRNRPISQSAWTVKKDWEIVESYSAIIRGYRNYYSFVDDPSRVKFIQFLLHYSCAKTLCAKRQTSVRKLFTKNGLNCKVPKKIDDEGKPTSFAQLDLRQSWKSEPFGFLNGEGIDSIWHGINLRTRSKIDENCAVCDGKEDIEMHHVKHIRKEKATGFTKVLQAINRKQIPVCRECHNRIHQGKYDGLRLSDLANPQVARR